MSYFEDDILDYKVVAVSGGSEITGSVFNCGDVEVGEEHVVYHHDCNGNKLETEAKIKEILSFD